VPALPSLSWLGPIERVRFPFRVNLQVLRYVAIRRSNRTHADEPLFRSPHSALPLVGFQALGSVDKRSPPRTLHKVKVDTRSRSWLPQPAREGLRRQKPRPCLAHSSHFGQVGKGGNGHYSSSRKHRPQENGPDPLSDCMIASRSDES
jgi:hypothetical protein